MEMIFDLLIVLFVFAGYVTSFVSYKMIREIRNRQVVNVEARKRELDSLERTYNDMHSTLLEVKLICCDLRGTKEPRKNNWDTVRQAFRKHTNVEYE